MNPTAQTWPQLTTQLAAAGWEPHDLRLVKAAFDEAVELFAASERGDGKPFVDHLVGTASGALLGGGDPAVVAASLLHAAYDMGDFGDLRAGPDHRHRDRLRGAVGETAEDLVHRYHLLGWGPEVAAASVRDLAGTPPRQRSVLLIRVANEVDDCLDGALRISGKIGRPEHDRRTHELLVDLAVAVAGPDLVALARDVLLADPLPVPPELVVGRVGGGVRLPASATLRLRFTASHLARRALGPSGRRVVKRWMGR